MIKLSPIKRKIYDFILSFKAEHDGCAPSIIEIAKACGMKSTSTVRYHLDGLESLKLIRCNYGKGKSRMIEIIGAQWQPGVRIGIAVDGGPFEYTYSTPVGNIPANALPLSDGYRVEWHVVR